MRTIKTVKLVRLSLLVALLSVGLTMTSCEVDECVETICVERIISARTSVTTIDLSGMNSDVSINAQGNLEEYQTTGDLNLNGYTLRLVNIKLTVVGNMNGNGTGGGSQVSTLGNSVVCVQGNIQNNPYYNDNDFYCESLSGGGSTSAYEGQIEVGCGETAIGDVFRSGNLWYEVVQCY